MRRLQVTAIWEIEEEDDHVSEKGLTGLAVLLREEIFESMGLDDPDREGDLHNLRVDVQMMPRTHGDEGHPDSPSYREDLVKTQSFIFPDDHALAGIERAYRSGKTPDQISREMIVQIDDFKGHC